MALHPIGKGECVIDDNYVRFGAFEKRNVDRLRKNM